MIGDSTFKGELPRIAPRALPPGFAQQAVNARLLSTNLEGWKNFSEVASLCKPGEIRTIFLLDDQYWLHWNASELAADAVEVDVARSIDGTDATGRVFLTGLDIPRYTTVALANGGSGCLPQITRPLGVPNPEVAPTVTASIGPSPAIDYTDAGGELSSWAISGAINATGTQVRYVQESLSVGNPAPSYQFVVQASQTNATMLRDFNLGLAAVIEVSVEFYVDVVTSDGSWSLGLRAAADSTGNGPALTVAKTAAADPVLGLSNGSAGVSVVTISALPIDTWYKATLVLARNPDGSLAAVATVTNTAGTVTYGTLGATLMVSGGFVQLSTANGSPWAAGQTEIYFDNIVVKGTGSFNDTTDDYTTSYVYTFVNDLGEESGPSPASAVITKDDGTLVTLASPVSPGSGYDYNVVSKRFYRAVTVAGSSAFYFIGEALISYAAFEDSLTNAEAVLNETLATELYQLPPSDLRGIMALPNSIYAGFSGRNLCLTPPGQPHAWPLEYRYAIDTNIVALGKIDAQVVIFGQSFPYLAGGNDPAVFSMVNTEVPQGSVSKRGTAYIKGLGVVSPTGDGLIAVAGTGQVTLLTEQLFTRDEWQALNPSSFVAEVHDNRYFAAFVKADGTRGAMILDASASGFGKITLGCHWDAAYTDASTDTLYLVLDENTVPEVGSGGAGPQVNPNGTTVYSFDTYEGGSPAVTPLLPYRWRSKRFLQPWRNCYRRACVRAESYDNLWFLLYADGVLVHTEAVANADAFVLPDTDANFLEYEIIGTDSVESVQLAHDVDELEG